MVEVKDSSLVIEAAAGASGRKNFSVDPAGRPLRLKKARIYFPAGTEGKLKVRIMYGNMAIIPENGYARGDNSEFVSEKEWLFDAGTPLAVEYVNEDTTNAKVAYVTITYEVEE
ncbi:MAG: hypothetical protein ACXQTR_03715 [Candidatus Methanospirareceae archaeon]